MICATSKKDDPEFCLTYSEKVREGQLGVPLHQTQKGPTRTAKANSNAN